MTSLDAPAIIGTGPSAIACAQALIDAGIRPVMIDGGNVAVGDRDRSVPRSAAPAVADARANPGEKLWFGSSFATDGHPGAPAVYDPGLVARPSYAVGGLSRIWGGTFSFFRELDRWPVEARPEEADLEAIRGLVPHSVTALGDAHDGEPPAGMIAGSHASARAMRAFGSVCREDWQLDSSTVAIDSRAGSPSRCQLLDRCLDGCAANSIWYAGDQLRRWVAEGRVRHLSGGVVSSLHETDSTVELTLSDGAASETVTAPRVYVAAGGIGSGLLLVRSGLREEVVLRDTATAFAGVLDLRPSRSGSSSRAGLGPSSGAGHHGLSQWWARTDDGRFLAQIYPPDAGNAGRLAARAQVPSSFQGTLSWLAQRLHPVVAYLASDASDTLRIAATGGTPSVKADHSAQSKQAMRTQLDRFALTLLKAGLLLPVFAAELSAPGTGYHFGASLPHGSATDPLGRLAELRRVHVVDASVLPSLELGSITPTVMANAHRIARQTVAVTAADDPDRGMIGLAG